MKSANTSSDEWCWSVYSDEGLSVCYSSGWCVRDDCCYMRDKKTICIHLNDVIISNQTSIYTLLNILGFFSTLSRHQEPFLDLTLCGNTSECFITNRLLKNIIKQLCLSIDGFQQLQNQSSLKGGTTVEKAYILFF